jgi:lysophospholipase L1-like esterase
MTTAPRRRRLATLVLLVVSTLAGLGAVELGLRATGFVRNLEVATSPVWRWVVNDPIVARTNRAGAIDEQFGLRINALDFRGPEITVAKPPGAIRIACLGDSTTFGIWNEAFRDLRASTSYPGELTALLAQHGYDDVEVINAGVLGYTSAHGVAQLLAQVVRLRPDVITVRFGNNDHGIHYGGEPLPATTAIDYAVLRWTPQLVLDLDTVRLAFHGFRRLRAGGNLPMRPETVPPDEFRRNLQHIVAIARAYGAHVLFIDFPYRPLERGISPGEAFPNPTQNAKTIEELHARHAAYQDIVREVARETGTPFLEMAPVMLARHREVFTDADMTHPNAAGYALMAQLLFDRLRELGWLPPR